MTTIPRELKKVNTHTNSRYLRELRQTLSLSENQKSVLFGALMGDGCIILTASGKNISVITFVLSLSINFLTRRDLTQAGRIAYSRNAL